MSVKRPLITFTLATTIAITHMALFTGVAMLFGDDPLGKAFRGEDYTQLVLIAVATMILGKKSIDLMFHFMPRVMVRITRS